jgi:hypothetical protein
MTEQLEAGADTPSTDDAPMDDVQSDDAGPGRLRRITARLTERPVLTTAAIAVLVAALNLLWVIKRRDLGAYNVDEAGYIATGLRYHRSIDLLHPQAFLSAVFSPSSTGVMVPLLSVPLLIIGPRNIDTVMATQALIGGIAAIAAAGVARRIAGNGTALVAGIIMLGLPALINSARSFQYAAGLGACMLLGLWALLASDRGYRRWPMVAFGAAVGVMPLTRTMALGYLPAMAIAALVVTRKDRRALGNLGLSVLAAVVAGGPWIYRSRQPLYDYLFGFGYGKQASIYGTENVWSRAWNRMATGLSDVRIPFVVLGCCVLLTAIAHLVWWLASGRGWRSWPGASRGLAALAAVVLCGYAALMSTANQGVWFELPLEMVAVTAVVALTGLVGGIVSRVAASAAVVLSIATFGISLTDPGGRLTYHDPVGAPREFLVELFSGSLDEKERVLADAEPRLYSNDRAVRRQAARDWWEVNQELVELIDGYHQRDPRTLVSVSGESHMLNGQTLQLAQVLDGLFSPTSEVVDTRLPHDELAAYTQPRWNGNDRVLILMEPRSLPFPESRQVPRLRALADHDGWVVDHRVELPDGGDVLVMVHPRSR